MDIGYFLKLMTEKNASDMFLTTGRRCSSRSKAALPLGQHRPAGRHGQEDAYSLMDEARCRCSRRPRVQHGHRVKDAGRFRVNCFKQRGEVAW